MADPVAPPPSYDDVVKGGFSQGPPATAPYPPAGYSQGMPPAASAYPPPVQSQGMQPAPDGGFQHYTYTTVQAGPVAVGGGHHYQYPGNQPGGTTSTPYQQPIVVPSSTFQIGAPVSNQNQQAKKAVFIFVVIFIIIFIIVVIIVTTVRTSRY